MENNRLLQILQRTVSENEIDKLSAHTLPHISEFNRSVILEMLQDKLLAQEEISEEKVTALKNTLENYLQIYLPDQKEIWKFNNSLQFHTVQHLIQLFALDTGLRLIIKNPGIIQNCFHQGFCPGILPVRV